MTAVPLMRLLGLKVGTKLKLGQCSERINKFVSSYQFFPGQDHLLSNFSLD